MIIKGKVIEGEKIGRTLGFPTANIEPVEGSVIPERGVYAVLVIIEGKNYKGMMNIGYRPTLNIPGLSIEVNLFEFDEDIYGKDIEVQIVKKIRDEVKFNGIEELKKQIFKDKIIVNDILSH
ncbi:MAG: riboflavin kinase [Bacteroidota bacterium]|nr:riboflavin kinase [Bacteroidota bacterium]